jgi:hypothetical protein
MRTWTLTENVQWIRSLPQEQQTPIWNAMAEAANNNIPDSQINESISNVRRQVQPTFGQMLLGLPLLVMGVVAAWDASNVLIDLPKATRNLANMKD